MKYPGTFRGLMRRVASSDPLLKTLDLRGFQLGADGSEDLAQALSTNDTVLEVILWVNHIGDRGATALAPVLASHPKLVKLDLFDNDISDSGAIALASVISKSKTLKELNLLSNMIGDEGAFAIATALENNNIIESLQLDKNKISDDGAAALGASIATSMVLTSFSLMENPNILDNTSITNINQWILRNQAARQTQKENNASARIAHELSFPIHSASQKSDLSLLNECIHSGLAIENCGILLNLCENQATSDRVDLAPALSGDRLDELPGNAITAGGLSKAQALSVGNANNFNAKPSVAMTFDF